MNKRRFLVIGGGFMATHFTNYLTMEGISYKVWKRPEEGLSELIKQSDTVFLLISDSSIADFIQNNPELKGKRVIHFSGALNIDGAIGFHPLMSFNSESYSLEEYREIPFIGSRPPEQFREYMPELKNSYHVIERSNKPYYHALCVLGGNFTSILWQKVARGFSEELGLPKDILDPYMKRVFTNILKDLESSLTGPIKRGDKVTMKKNRRSLGKLWSKIYKLFNRAYREELR